MIFNQVFNVGCQRAHGEWLSGSLGTRKSLNCCMPIGWGIVATD